jgi:hypothetical protein
MRFRRKSVTALFAILAIGIWLWVSMPRLLDQFSQRSKGGEEIHLGPFVNTVSPSQQELNHCFSNGWTRSCYKSVEEMGSAGRSSQSAFDSGSCESPTRIVGTALGKPQTIFVIGRSALIPIVEVFPNFQAKTIFSGSCEVIIYDMNDPSEPGLLAILGSHRSRHVGAQQGPVGVFQK